MAAIHTLCYACEVSCVLSILITNIRVRLHKHVLGQSFDVCVHSSKLSAHILAVHPCAAHRGRVWAAAYAARDSYGGHTSLLKFTRASLFLALLSLLAQ